ncbi:MAG TPA: NUDIX hydrolase [Nanoarchaeota archaeon]|nr:NUDIX hydrolase [Nanoarchaeota archaeon]
MEEDYNGVIGIVYIKGNPKRYVLIHNQKTGNITFPAGGKEPGENSSKITLEREIREELGLYPGQYKVIPTGIIHEFVYNKKKIERINQKAKQPVYLVETNIHEFHPEDPDAKIDGLYTQDKVLERLTFDDAKKLFKRISY